VTKTFYLANRRRQDHRQHDPHAVKTKDMHVDEKLNLIVIRDTPDAVRMAERLVANQDLAEPEVMLEVEVMEVGSNVLTELGIHYPSSVSFSLVGAGGTPGSLRCANGRNRSSDLVRMTISDPFLALNFATSSPLESARQPAHRVKNKDKAKSAYRRQGASHHDHHHSTGFAAESVTYLDVGLKLDVERRSSWRMRSASRSVSKFEYRTRNTQPLPARSRTRSARAPRDHAAPQGWRNTGACRPDQRRRP